MRTRRVKKKMSESLIGEYDATQLLIFAEPNLYVLDPLARFVPGAQGGKLGMGRPSTTIWKGPSSGCMPNLKRAY